MGMVDDISAALTAEGVDHTIDLRPGHVYFLVGEGGTAMSFRLPRHAAQAKALIKSTIVARGDAVRAEIEMLVLEHNELEALYLKLQAALS